MSLKIMTLAWNTELRQTEKLVLLALADNANDEGQCFPAIATLQRKCCLTDRGVQKVIGRLAELKHISQHFRTGKSTVYTVHPRTMVPPEPRFTPERTFTPPPNGGSPPPPNGGSGDPRTVVHPNLQEPSVEPPGNPKGMVSLHESLPSEEWGEWIAHRKARRWPCDSTTLKKQLKTLAAYDTATQREMIDKAINAGWQGIFPPRTNGAPAAPARTWRPGPEDCSPEDP